FDYNPVTIDNEMAQLSQLEGFLLQHPGATLDEMVATGNPLASFVSHPDGVSNFDLVNEKALGIPGFLWGCCLSWVGILVVYLVADDPHETKMAIIGCVVNALLSGVSYGGYYWSLSRSYY
ncbi:MAG: hypothetical protein J7L89_03160, partial [Bacteroidales bacterium]|nr:hypothetical protein [Bacteroidales bacterium]